MKKTPKISVLMPAYNAGQYIATAIESILNQTFSDFEFIIVNDGSTDDTAAIVAKYAKADKRIKFIDNKKNQGLIAVLNQGLDMARGEYIARMDSDDISLPQRFARQVEYMDANPDVGVLGTAGQNFGADNSTNISPEIVDVIELIRGVGFYHPSVMMRKSVLDEYNLRYDPNYPLAEDHELWSRMMNFTKLRNIPDVLLKYRVHESSVSVANLHRQEIIKQFVRQKMLNQISENHAVQNELRRIATPWTIPNRVFYTKLFGIIPIVKTVRRGANDARVFLFNVLPLVKIKRNKVYLFHAIKIARNIPKQTKELHFNNFCQFNCDNSQLLDELNKMGRFTYIPNSGNLGDMLIAGATLGFFDANNFKYKLFNGKSDRFIVYGGGGQWTADYEQHWLKWLKTFKNAERIVILPSSFNECQKLIDILDERFVVFCREEQSFKYMTQAKTKAKIILDHDMAFRITPAALRGKIAPKTKEQKRAIKKIRDAIPSTKRVAMLMRQDCESAGHFDTDFDLSGVIYGQANATKQHIMFCTKLMFMGVDSADVIVTDRLHVAIAATVSGKQVYMIDNTYKKLSNVYKHSMQAQPHVHFCTKMPQVQDIKCQRQDKPNFALLGNL